jgi:hypothetical protein
LSFADTTYNIIILNRSLGFLYAGFEFAETVGKTDLEPAAKVIVLADSCIITLIGDRLVMVILVEGHIGREAQCQTVFLEEGTLQGSTIAKPRTGIAIDIISFMTNLSVATDGQPQFPPV